MMPVSFQTLEDIDWEQIKRDFDASLERHLGIDKMTFVSEKLQSLISLYEERNKTYGNDYRENGKLMATLFPDGITLITSDDFNRYSILVHIVTKIGRYTRNFEKGHLDSLNDLIVYAAMLAELDNEI